MADSRLNVVLLTVDSLRADHLGCYDYRWPTSPFTDSLAANGVRADRFFAPAIPTQPSYTTLLTGQLPITHNIVSHGGRAEIAPDTPSLPELFLQAGYTTCAVDNLWRQRQWFGRGFEYVVDPSPRRSLFLAIDCDGLNHRAIPWIRQHIDEPFFLMLHYWDPHYPYNPPQGYRRLFYEGGNPTDPNNHELDPWWDHIIGMMARETWLRTAQGVITDPRYVTAMYDQEIRHLDDGLRDIVTAVDDLGLAENTLIIVIGDHGESMTEHGIFYEHYGLYDTVLRVPMIMRLPGTIPADTCLPHMLQHSDIAPTVLEAAGIDIPESMDGRSFWQLATGRERNGGHAEVISEECTWQACWSLRTETHKFILAREPDEDGAIRRELYDLTADAAEERNIVAEQPDVAAAMETRLETWIAERLRVTGRSDDPLLAQGISMRPIEDEEHLEE